MAIASAVVEPVLEVVSPDRSRRLVSITGSPFFIGRGETGNHLQLADTRISRQCAAITSQGGCYRLEDRGHRRGLYVNGKKVDQCVLQDGDVIDFGIEESYEIIFRSSAADTSIQNILSRIGSVTGGESVSGGLGKLNLLLAATSLLHSQLPLDSVLGSMLDHAISVTNADRGLLLEADSAGALRARLARRSGCLSLPPESVVPSQTALRQALENQSSVITEDLAQADLELQAAQSIVAQRLRAVVAIPLYEMHRASSTESATQPVRKDLLGMVYLDSRRAAAFSKIDREILDVLGVEAASILDNARLLERERQQQRLEQQLSIAREIQQALLPCGLSDFPHLAVAGTNSPCLAVGGDYFDVFQISEDRTAFLIADVSGKGLGAALLTTMLQGALSGVAMGADPARVFLHINKFLCAHAEVGKYATIFFGILGSDGQLEFINAGHPSPILLRGGETAEPFADGSCPVGLVPTANYAAARTKLQHGDTLVLFSDGITEAADPEDNLFGVDRLREVLAGQQDAPLNNLQKIVLESVGQFARGASQADDITLLLVRYRDAAATAAT
ncbi:MAG TPA: SpoIIE family protein phosphatase [Candidatus Acidoferrales bacterium]|nr:SpoIIE family protein phosphatase [Candidatus Acidoferrales bacterium]